MNRINLHHWIAVTTYLWHIHFNSQNSNAKLMYQTLIKEVRSWCAIRETIRKGYKRVKE